MEFNHPGPQFSLCLRITRIISVPVGSLVICSSQRFIIKEIKALSDSSSLISWEENMKPDIAIKWCIYYRGSVEDLLSLSISWRILWNQITQSVIWTEWRNIGENQSVNYRASSWMVSSSLNGTSSQDIKVIPYMDLFTYCHLRMCLKSTYFPI